jgi:uncharacterized protein (TIGR03067 family)
MKKDVDILQGAWGIVRLEIDGRNMPTGTAQIVLKGNRFTTTGMGAEYEGTIAVDGKKKPKTLDMTFTTGPEKGNKNLGIFEVSGDTWRLCLDMTGKSRPKEFASKPGSGVALETLRRASDSGSRKKAAAPPVQLDQVPAPELEGEWAMVSCTINGDPLPASFAKHGKRVARKNEITVTMSGQVMVQAKFTVDRDKSPKTIDYLLSNGQLQHGIYEFEGKKLKVIFSAPGQTRPADFSTKSGDGKTLTTWKLAKQ